MAQTSLDECLAQCLETQRVCQETMAYGLAMDHGQLEPRHLQLLMDATEAAHLAGQLLLRGSDAAAAACVLCAEICEACAEACEVLSDDIHLRACQEQCLACAEACRRYAELPADWPAQA